ncbi:putative baseplate assembly protein [Microcoleus sp. Pol11C3]|uniref:putative baseplate assembly protein n=1 Tax=Microcoleus sp. Pol11C3 TaxID=3055390 RepID=UPI002FD2F6BA
MSTQYRCNNQQRRTLVRQTEVNGRPRLNGIDYLEVASDRKTLKVYFIHPIAESTQNNRLPLNLASLTAENVVISGGTRLQGVQVESVSSFANTLTVRVDQVGDFSTYTLRLVKSPASSTPPEGFDSQLSEVDFSFWTEAISEFDCQSPEPLPEKEPPPPVIDYLAKDYASFRHLMLDRLAVTMPQWQERNPADLGIMLVELLAYAADHLSYYQDAVATEAYLGTARKRVSVRRHVRLLDYLMHDGCNARAWVVVHLKDENDQANSGIDGIKLLGPSKEDNRSGVQFLTKTTLANAVLPADKFNTALQAGAQVFESLHDIILYHSLDTIHFYTWGNEQCYLPKGSTQATLHNKDGLLSKRLTRNSVLVLEEVRGWETGEQKDTNRQHRHVVRLTQIEDTIDLLTGDKIVEVAWAVEDALPFDLYISNIDAQGKPIHDISVARGNVVLVDAGRSLISEDLRENPGWQRLRPRLKEGPLTQHGLVQDRQRQWVAFDPTAPASKAMQWQLRDARPAIALWENQVGEGVHWEPQRDLLVSDRFARDFVVEAEDDGRAFLRFGDNTLGRKPQPDTPLYACYRIGNGRAGNVGAEAIAHIVIQPENLEPEDQLRREDIQTAIIGVHNPLSALGGTEPEPIEQARLYAPQAFRQQRRAVTEADYAEMAQRYPGVNKALATRRWTGSWHTIFITVDREGGRLVDREFQQGLKTFLEEFRLAGHDIEIDAPRFVPLDIAITVQIKPEYFRSTVKQVLLDAFSNQILVNGKEGFFHPDRFSFGETVYLSPVVAAAMQVSGVQSVSVNRFQRWGQSATGELETGKIQFERLEIACLDNTPNVPENGRIEFNLEGGL